MPPVGKDSDWSPVQIRPGPHYHSVQDGNTLNRKLLNSFLNSRHAMVLVRPYKISEYDELMRILDENAQFDPDLDSEENLRRKIQDKPHTILVAESEGRLVGCAFAVSDGVRIVSRIAVHKDYWSNGVLADLIRGAEDEYRRQGARKVSFLVREDPKDSRIFATLLTEQYAPGNRHQSMSKKI